MLNRFYSYMMIVCSIGFSIPIYAQLNMQFVPEVHGQTLEGLAHLQINSAYPAGKQVYIKITVRGNTSGQILSGVTPPFNLMTGLNQINRSAFSGTRFVFGKNDAGFQLSQTGKFLPGEYEYCFEAIVGDEKLGNAEYFDNCFTGNVSPAAPLMLINPMDGDELCNTRPNFSWQPMIPLVPNTRYRFLLVQKSERQSPEEAINNNVPVIFQSEILGNMLLYPPSIRELLKDREYAWQVTAYSGNSILTKSEIWQFKIKCEEEKPLLVDDSYRELREVADPSPYLAQPRVRFSFNNPYNEGTLSYSIAGTENTLEPIKKLPVLKMQRGLNKLEINLEDWNAFKTGKEYLLSVRLENGKVLKMRFTYKEQ